MNRKTARRQMWLVVVLGGLALLWWQSSISDRYADLSGYDVAQRPLPMPPGLDSPELARVLNAPAEWYFASRSDSAGIRVNWQTKGGVTTVEVTTVDSGRVTRRVGAELARGYYPNWLLVHDVHSGTVHDVRISGDSMYVQGGGASGTSRVYPYPKGALFEDLVLVQAMAWRDLADSATTQVIAFSDAGTPVRVFSVTLRRPDTATLLVTASPTQTARLHFAGDSRRIASYCITTGDCFESRREPTSKKEMIEMSVDSLVAEESP